MVKEKNKKAGAKKIKTFPLSGGRCSKPCYNSTHATPCHPHEPSLSTATSGPGLPNLTLEPSLLAYVSATESSPSLLLGDNELQMVELCKRREVEVKNEGEVDVEVDQDTANINLGKDPNTFPQHVLIRHNHIVCNS